MVNYKFGERCKIKLLTAAQSFMNCSLLLPRKPLQFLVMFFSICHTHNKIEASGNCYCNAEIRASS